MAFLWLQAALVAAWWITLWLAPDLRPAFTFPGWPEDTLLSFVLADVALLVCGSALAAHGLRQRRPWARTLFAAVVGAALYALLWCVGAFWLTGGGGLSVALMALCVAGNSLAFHLARP